MGSWAAGLPALSKRLDLGPGILGTVLLLVSLGCLLAMPVAGRLCDRWSSRTVTRVSGPLMALALLGPVLAPSFGVLAVAAVLFGLTVGLLEVSMNVQAVEVERVYGRPINSAFHGSWSLGGAAGGAIVAGGLHLGLDARVPAVVAVAAAAAGFLAAGPRLLSAAATAPAEEEGAAPAAPLGRRMILLLGAVAFAGLLTEGAAMDWAAVHAAQVLHADSSLAPLTFTVFSVAMTTVRLFGDQVRRRLRPPAILGLAGGITVAGYALALSSSAWSGGAAIAVAWAGWILAGVGLATVVPVLFSAVGAAGGPAGRALSQVSAVGYVGLLIGPALVGHLAEATSLSTALILPAGLALLVALAGPPALRVITRPKVPVR
ncbi:MFS transporter [Bailinhaonella thermotolerans]|uniref:MFS transporter n=2 Tax=Bailinhaonella thermotolerans TaxID=1070861 RepID=A0A3A4AU83_9ACTN|nr:MFS transporter [Bailinhaonella thermotolerans]